MEIKNRIIGEGMENPEQLLANPKNWRTHPQFQQEALTGVLKEVGFVQRVIVNKRTGYIVDGHARVMIALSENSEIPVLYVDLSEEEEALILATLDPIGTLAGVDDEQLRSLLDEVNTGDSALMQLLDKIAIDAGLVPPIHEQNQFNEVKDSNKFILMVEFENEGQLQNAYEEYNRRGLQCKIID